MWDENLINRCISLKYLTIEKIAVFFFFFFSVGLTFMETKKNVHRPMSIFTKWWNVLKHVIVYFLFKSICAFFHTGYFLLQTLTCQVTLTLKIYLYTPIHLHIYYKCKVDSSVQPLSHVQLFATPWIAVCQAPYSSPDPGAYSNSCLSNQWCHPIISSSIIHLSSCLHSFPALGSFPMSQFFASGSQSIGVSASASVLPMNIQDRFPLGLTGWTFLLSKGPQEVFSNTTVQKHQFFCT